MGGRARTDKAQELGLRTVEAQFLAAGSVRKPDGSSAIVRTPYTIQATFSADITESPRLPVPIPQ